jgi:hypothetical protein
MSKVEQELEELKRIVRDLRWQAMERTVRADAFDVAISAVESAMREDEKEAQKARNEALER